MTPAKRLLRDIDSLSYPARSRLLAERASALAGSSDLDALLDDLDRQHDDRVFARLLALRLAVIARHHGHIERCLAAPHIAVRVRAVHAAVRLGLPTAVVATQLPDLPAEARRALYRAVRRYRATDLAETLLPAVADRFGATEAQTLLPVCRSSTVAAWLPELDHALTGWRYLGERHPAELLNHLDATVSRTPRSALHQLLTRLGAGVAAAARFAPDRVLTLLERTVDRAPIPPALATSMAVLARHDPARLLGILTDPRRTGPVPGGRSLWRALVGAGDDQLTALGRVLAPVPAVLVKFLRAVPPSRRAAIYAGVLGERDLVSTGIPLHVLDLLPVPARTTEAERLLGLRSVADDRNTRLAVTARLPWDRARDVLRDATRRPTADERAAAYPLYVTAAVGQRDPAAVTELIGSLTRLANEQDPVRLPAIRALAQVPPWLLHHSTMDSLVALATEAVRARDCSWLTAGELRKLAGRLVVRGAIADQPRLVQAGLDILDRLGGHRAFLQLSGLDRELPRGAEHRVFAALRHRISVDARRGEFRMALSLADGLGRRAWHMPELQAFVDQARHATEDNTVRRALELWLAPPATQDERVAEALRADRSTITLPAVSRRVGLRRTDLLDEVLSKPLHGRFLAKKVRHVPHLTGFDRWLPRQVAAYAKLLSTLATARSASVWERADAVRRLSGMPGTTETLRTFAASDEVMVAEAALTALAHAEEPAAVLGDLLARVDTDRARVAVFAVSRCTGFLAPDTVRSALEPMLSALKVTTRKEAVRLLAGRRVPGAAAVLTDVWDAPEQHRDIRRAVVWACGRLLDDERAWTLLRRAAESPPEATALLDLDPGTIAERHRSRYAELIHTVIGTATDEDTARLGLAALTRWSRWDTAGTAALVDRVTTLTTSATWRASLTALVARCTATESFEPLRALLDHLLDHLLTLPAGPDADADRDLPARQRILALAHAVREGAPRSPTLRAAAAELATRLADVPTLRRIAVELALAAVPLHRQADCLAALRRVADLADRPIWAWHAHHALRTALTPVVPQLPPHAVHTLATDLAGTPNGVDAPAAGLLAVAVTDAAGRHAGWPAHWRSLLRVLREHRDHDVRLGALDVFTSPE